MNWRPFSRLASDLALAALLVAVVWPAAAFADGAAVKCAPNEERVWLYDSVTSLNVETKLKCGESVEVIGQQSGYVKVRTANGTEGYLPESNLPKLPVGGDASGAQPIPGAPPTLASDARAAAARRAAAADSSNAAASAAVAPMRANVEVSPGAVNASPAMQAKTVAAVAAASAQPAAPTGSVKTISNTTTASATTTTSSGAVTPAAAIPASAHSSTAAAHAKPKAAAKSATTTTVTTSAKTPSGNPAGSSNPSAPSAPRPATSAPLHVAAATPAPKAPSAQPAAVVATDIYVGGPANSGSAPKAAANAPKVRTVAETSDDDDDSYLTRPKNESDDPSCQTYFSGYGLSPGQFKWLEDNRVKKYPSVCPAASPAMVDYVIIFTHDVDFFNYTMPAPVHYEAGGFSDWTPVLQYDTSVVSHSDIDKSRREYVWVFHVKRGAFDPNKFSPHRRFQYTKSESKYSRTVEDAFEFIGGQGGER